MCLGAGDIAAVYCQLPGDETLGYALALRHTTASS
jgi:hypothetical protein